MKFQPKNTRQHVDEVRLTRQEARGTSRRQRNIARAIIAGMCLVLAIILHFVTEGG